MLLRVLPPAPGSLAGRTLWNALGSVGAALGRVVAAIAVARLLGPELAGRYALLVWILELACLGVGLGLPTALTRYLARLGDDAGGGRTLLAWLVPRVVAAALAGAGALFALAPALLELDRPLAAMLALLLLLQGLSALLGAYLAGMQAFAEMARLNLATALVLVLAQPWLAARFGLSGALLGLAVSLLVQVRWLPLLRTAGVTASPPPASLPGYARSTWLAALVSAFTWTRAELFFLDRWGAPGEAGFFTVGNTLFGLVGLGTTLLTGALLPHFSVLEGGADHARVQRDYARFTLLVALFALPAALIGAALAPLLVPLLFGPAFAAAGAPTAVLLGCGVLAAGAAGSHLLHAFGRADFILITGLLGALLLALGCGLSVPRWGAWGAAWVRFAVQALMMGIGTAYIHRRLAVIPPYAALCRILLAAGLGAAVAALLLSLLDDRSPAVRLVLGAGFGGLAYLAALRGTRALPLADVAALKAVAAGLPGVLGAVSCNLIGRVFPP